MLIRKEDRKTANVFIFRVCFCLGSVVLGWALITPAGGTLPLSGAQFQGDKGNAHYARAQYFLVSVVALLAGQD